MIYLPRNVWVSNTALIMILIFFSDLKPTNGACRGTSPFTSTKRLSKFSTASGRNFSDLIQKLMALKK